MWAGLKHWLALHGSEPAPVKLGAARELLHLPCSWHALCLAFEVLPTDMTDFISTPDAALALTLVQLRASSCLSI